MKIILNNTDEYFQAESMSISDLLKIKNFTFKMLVIKVNGKLVKNELRDSTFLKDGDNVTVLHLISGG
ncbi:MAG: sulfur carrier protein ThiS [Bacteroidia bacterium]|nr:sulfur carrier protein ThiS [Bacteroidia bacterium]